MKKSILLLFVFASVTISGLAQAKPEQLVLDLSKKKFDWLINKQYDSLELLLDDQLKYIHSNGWVQSKKEVFEDSRSGKLVYQKIEITESAVRRYDNTAIVTGKGKFSGIGNGNSFAMELAYTEVYVKSNNRWRLASRHANRMP
jgi:predicted RNA-binding protein with PUA domain